MGNVTSNYSQKYSKALYWGKLVSITGGSQVVVQIISLVCGLVIIRLLPEKEYAYYTLANTMLGMMIVLSDGGVGVGTMAFGGKVWNNADSLGKVQHTAFSLRKKFGTVSLLVSLPIMSLLLYKNDAPWITIAFIVASIVPAFWSALSDTLYEIPLKLHQEVKLLQKNQLLVNLGRFLLTVLLLLVFPFSAVAIIAFGIPRLYGNVFLRKIAAKYTTETHEVDKVIEKEILKIVSLSFPGLIYYCISGQLNIWLISIFGHTQSIAQLGALGRLAMIFSIVSNIISTVFVPQFARLPNDHKKLFKYFGSIQLLLIVFSIISVGFVYFFPNPVLWILGKQYSNLQSALFLSVIGVCLNLLVGTTYIIYSARGFVMSPFRSISVSVGSVIAGIIIFDLSEIRGVLLMNIFVAIIELINHWIYSFEKLVGLKFNNKAENSF